MTTAFIASNLTQPTTQPHPKMPSDSEPAAAALPNLQPLEEQLALLKACNAHLTDEIKRLQRDAAARGRDPRALKESREALSDNYARLLQENAELKTKYTLNLELLTKAQARELDSKSSVLGQLVDWFANGGTNPIFAHDDFPNFVQLHEQHMAK